MATLIACNVELRKLADDLRRVHPATDGRGSALMPSPVANRETVLALHFGCPIIAISGEVDNSCHYHKCYGQARRARRARGHIS